MTPADAASDTASQRSMFDRWGWGALLLVAGLCVYSNCYNGEFIFDDNGGIIGNHRIRNLFSFEALTAPPRTTNAGRPTVSLSLAINHALCGMDVRGYRAFNLAIHLATGLALFGLVRLTLRSPRLRERWSDRASAVAFFAALVFVVHPLPSIVVNYVIQRAESLMALFYLLTFYLAAKGWADATRRGLWHSLAVAACVLGMGSKEVMVSAPILLLLYDWIFNAGLLRGAARKSWPLYAGVAATWLILIGLLATGAAAAGNENARMLWTPWEYLRTQAGVILYYVLLAFVPEPLCFDYGWDIAREPAQYLAAVALVGACGLLTLFALLRRSPWGFAFALFFCALAPSSSVIALPDVIVEYRFYLPLAALCTAAVAAAALLCERFQLPELVTRRAVPAAAVGIALVLGVKTFLRNEAYRSAESVWRDSLEKQPQNARAHANLGIALAQKGKLEDAAIHLLTAWKLKSDVEALHLNLGSVLAMLGRRQEAAEHFKEAIRQEPQNVGAHYNLANVLSELNRFDEAAAEYEAAIALKPDLRDAHLNYAVELYRRNKLEKAEQHLKTALQADPEHAGVHYMLGLVFARRGEKANAERQFAEALQRDPRQRRRARNWIV
jgi:protein O-mannosyl-transferase